MLKMNQIGRIFIFFLFWFKLNRNWYVIIGFGPKWKINKISFISPIHFNFFLKYDKVPSVSFTLKGFICRYKNYKQITLIKFIFLFLLKKCKNLFHVSGVFYYISIFRSDSYQKYDSVCQMVSVTELLEILKKFIFLDLCFKALNLNFLEWKKFPNIIGSLWSITVTGEQCDPWVSEKSSAY